jgi:hypothetical protein
MSDFPLVKVELVAGPDVPDRFKLELHARNFTLDKKSGCIQIFLDSGDLSNLSHDITVARFEDDEQSGKLRTV